MAVVKCSLFKEAGHWGNGCSSVEVGIYAFSSLLETGMITRVMFYKKQLIRNIVHFCQKLRNKN